MTNRIACSDATFPLLTPEKFLDLVVLLEIPAVDLGLFEGRSQLQPSQVFQNTERSASQYKKQLNDRGLELSDLFLQMDLDFAGWAINHPDASRRRKAREWFQHSLDFSLICGCRHITGLPGVLFSDESPQSSISRAVEELSWRCEQASQANIVYSVEAHVGSLVPQPELALNLLRQVPGLTLTLDLTHFIRQGIDQSEADPLLPFASHLHIRGARPGRLQTSFAENTIDYNRLLNQLRAENYTGDLTLEYVWIDWEHCNEVDNLSETILWKNFLLAREQR